MKINEERVTEKGCLILFLCSIGMFFGLQGQLTQLGFIVVCIFVFCSAMGYVCSNNKIKGERK